MKLIRTIVLAAAALAAWASTMVRRFFLPKVFRQVEPAYEVLDPEHGFAQEMGPELRSLEAYRLSNGDPEEVARRFGRLVRRYRRKAQKMGWIRVARTPNGE